jgi:predicted protein tyrosine phosphatase
VLVGRAHIDIKSAGTEPNSRMRVNEGHIGWADLIFVMEKKHRRMLQETFPQVLNGKQIICLHIPDEFSYMEPALIAELKTGLAEYMQLPE